ncbi:dihydropteroate synthase [candidate division KSB1 bacterium]|nr:dihydropteroate synthase [candidate division KSB1 bacterium]
MPIDGLKIIGESINDSVPSTHQLYNENKMYDIVALAKFQDERGAAYIDVNIGSRPASFMADLVRRIQQVTTKPLSIDTPDMEIAAAGLEAYDMTHSGGQKPILNSISLSRLEMFDLYKQQPFIPILLITEGLDKNKYSIMNSTAQETYSTAKDFVRVAFELIPEFSNDQCILDPGIMPIGGDMEGYFKRLMDSLQLIHDDPDLQGVNMSVGLSNFTVMLPSKRADGSPVKGPLESAFLTLAIPLGLNMVIGTVKRKYQLLDDDHPALQCLKDILQLNGIEVITRVMQFYS